MRIILIISFLLYGITLRAQDQEYLFQESSTSIAVKLCEEQQYFEYQIKKMNPNPSNGFKFEFLQFYVQREKYLRREEFKNLKTILVKTLKNVEPYQLHNKFSNDVSKIRIIINNKYPHQPITSNLGKEYVVFTILKYKGTRFSNGW